jgi:hypothetical protein
MSSVCFFVLRNRHWFNKAGQGTELGVTYLPFVFIHKMADGLTLRAQDKREALAIIGPGWATQKVRFSEFFRGVLSGVDFGLLGRARASRAGARARARARTRTRARVRAVAQG